MQTFLAVSVDFSTYYVETFFKTREPQIVKDFFVRKNKKRQGNRVNPSRIWKICLMHYKHGNRIRNKTEF